MFNWHQNKKWGTITFDKISSWIEWSRKLPFYSIVPSRRSDYFSLPFSLPWQHVIIKFDFVCWLYCNMLFSCLTLGLIMHCCKTSKGIQLEICCEFRPVALTRLLALTQILWQCFLVSYWRITTWFWGFEELPP